MPQAVTKFPNLRVLAVEDYMTNQEILEAMLIDFACDFEIVDNNTDALELHANHPFDVILMDMMVPDIDGHEATKRIRRMPGPAGRTPVIAVTAKSLHGDPARWLNAGMTDYLTKPVKIRDLEQAFLRVAPGKAVRSR